MMKDMFKAFRGVGGMKWEDLIEMRAANPNLLMRKKVWDKMIEEMVKKLPIYYCVHHIVHEKPFKVKYH